MLQADTLIECINCGRVGHESEAQEAGWRYSSDGTDLDLVCALCAYRASRADVPASKRVLSDIEQVMEGSILALLERHGSLAYEQISALLRERPNDVRNTLTQLRDYGLIDAVKVGRANSATSWKLTDSGRAALAALRAS